MTRSGLLVLLSLVALVGGCSDSSTPTSPTPVTSTTRIIALSGNLAYGSVSVGSSSDATLTITNTGNAALTVTSMSISGGMADHVRANWTSGTIAPSASQAVRLTFQPQTAGTWNSTLTVNADQTSGSNTIPISATATGVGVGGLWDGSYVVERCDGTGSIQDLFCSANRGTFPVGSTLPIELLLEQSGNNVNGLVAFGDLIGEVSGTVSQTGVLTLQGSARLGGTTVTITSWNTQVSGDAMTGPITFNLSANTLPGVAAITARLTNMTRYDLEGANVPQRARRLTALRR